MDLKGNDMVNKCMVMGGLILISSSALCQTFYQSVDSHGNVTLSDRPMARLKIVKKYEINIQDHLTTKQAPISTHPPIEEGFIPPSRVYNPYDRLDKMNATLVAERERDAKEYRDCIDANRERRDLGASLELLCKPRFSVFFNQNEISNYQAEIQRRGY